MKFLFDQSADFRLIAHLRQLGHEVSAVSRDYPHGLADEDVLAIARDEKRILLVADRDFGELIFHQALLHTGVIFFRLPGANLETKIEHLNTVLEDHRDERDGTGNPVGTPVTYPQLASAAASVTADVDHRLVPKIASVLAAEIRGRHHGQCQASVG